MPTPWDAVYRIVSDWRQILRFSKRGHTTMKKRTPTRKRGSLTMPMMEVNLSQLLKAVEQLNYGKVASKSASPNGAF